MGHSRLAVYALTALIVGAFALAPVSLSLEPASSSSNRLRDSISRGSIHTTASRPRDRSHGQGLQQRPNRYRHTEEHVVRSVDGGHTFRVMRRKRHPQRS